MYITDATHFLDEKGAIGPQHGPGRTMADFLGTAIVAATLSGTDPESPICFICTDSVRVHVSVSGAIEWLCAGCGESGRITHWEGTLWDMSINTAALHAEH